MQLFVFHICDKFLNLYSISIYNIAKTLFLVENKPGFADACLSTF